MSKRIAQVVFGLPLDKPFDYLIPNKDKAAISVGSRVYVPFGHRKLVGYVVKLLSSSTVYKIKPILSVLDNGPALSRRDLKFTKDFSQYYGCSWGEAISSSLPSVLRTKHSVSLKNKSKKQSTASIGKMRLCLDVGLEKRWAYISKTIKSALSKGKSVIFLVPEVYLGRKIYQRLNAQFEANIVLLDKKLSVKKESQMWVDIKEGKTKIIIGTRSAVFLPAYQLGLIVVYEEENSAFKQEQSPFYHVREVARMRCSVEGSDILFVSSAPSVELYFEMNKRKGAINKCEANHLAALQAVDLANYKPRQKSAISFPLQTCIENTLLRKGKIVLFLNKRGFSSKTQCNQCGNVIKCKRCNVNLAYMYSKKKLVCPLCQSMTEQPKICPNCNSSYLRSTGGGVEKVESNTSRVFPMAQIEKYDKDTEKIPAHADIIIATQAIIKRLDEMNIDLIGVLDMDGELNRPDFRSSQKAFSLLIHLRQLAKQSVLIQTYQPENYCIRSAINMDFKTFYKTEAKFRKECNFPPFHHLFAIVLRGPKEEKVLEQASRLFELLKKKLSDKVEVLDPQPDFRPKLRDKYRYTIMVKGSVVKKVLSGIKGVLKDLRKANNVIITVNVDP